MDTMWKAIVFVTLFCLANGFEDKTIVQWLQDNGYTTLSSTLAANGLDTALSGSGKICFFFRKLSLRF